MKLRARIPRPTDYDATDLLTAMRSPFTVTLANAPFGTGRVLEFDEEFFEVEIETGKDVSIDLDSGQYVVAGNNKED